jgi:alpha-galactosidase
MARKTIYNAGVMNAFCATVLISLWGSLPSRAFAQRMSTKSTPKISVHHILKDVSAPELVNSEWESFRSTEIDRQWNGKKAPVSRHFSAKLFWSDTAFYVRFEANQAGLPIVSDKPQLDVKTMGLWDRDVCEIFIAPDGKEPRKYFEFEIAPNGEWIDLAIDLTSGKRETDWNYRSGMESAAKIEKDKVIMAIRVPWKALGRSPKTGDVWKGNLFRCVGTDPDRGYLAWRPTETAKPNFHVPGKFGEFEFVNKDQV